MNSIAQATEIESTGINKVKVAYFLSTGLLTLMMLGSAGMYVFNNAEIAKVFVALGYPTYIIYPLAAAKVLGLIAIWTRFSKPIANLAYAGFFYDFILATGAHIMVSDGEFFGAVMAMTVLAGSYFSGKKYSKD